LLFKRVLQGSSMPVITGILEAIIPYPIILVDLTSDSLHVSRSPDAERFSDREWAELVQGPGAPSLIRLVQQTQSSEFQRLTTVRVAAPRTAFEREAYVEPLRVDGDTVGGLIIFPRQRGLDRLDLLIAIDMKFALCVQLMRTHIQQHSRESQVSELFMMLFERRWSDARQVQIRASRLGVEVGTSALLLALDLEGARHPEKLDSKHLLRSLYGRVRASCPGAAIFEGNGMLFIHVPCLAEGSENITATVGRQMLEAVRWHGRSRPVLAVGPLCRQLEDYEGAHEQCLRLLTLARILGRQGIVRQHEFGPFPMLLSALDQKAVSAFTDEVLGRLELYDEANGTDMLRTASAFIDQGCRFQSTAEFLRIHISTLRYRLQRIEELFGLDLEDAEQRFSLSLAVRLRTLMRNRSDTC
jgi:sugar diacid utilization regulator